MPEIEESDTGLDITSITELLYTYARGVDSKDWAVWRSVFSSDAHIDHSALTGVTGSPEVASAALESALATTRATMHYNTNVSVLIDGDAARVDALYLAVVVFDGADTPLYSGGTYRHDVVRTPEGWRIRRLVVSPKWYDQRQT